MYIPKQIVHDLKTDRADALPPLASALWVVPLAFYLTVIGGLALVVITVLQIRTTAVNLETTKKETADLQAQVQQTRTTRAQLEARAKTASDILTWVEGANAVQPLTVAISRSVNARAAITELTMGRDDKNPRQIQLLVKLQGADSEQIEAIIEAIRSADFRPFSARQSQDGNRVTYETSLIRQVQGTGGMTEDTASTAGEVAP